MALDNLIINQYIYDTVSDTTGVIDDDKYILFSGKYICQIGIQGLPGTKLYFNSTTYPIIIGSNGYFEISSTANIIIEKLYIDAKSMDLISKNPAAMLIVDTIEKLEENGGNN